MRIDKSNQQQQPHKNNLTDNVRTKQTNTSGTVESNVASSTAGSAPKEGSARVNLSTRLLKSLISENREVRDQLVIEIRQKLDQGQLTSDQAAVKTAEAILDE